MRKLLFTIFLAPLFFVSSAIADEKDAEQELRQKIWSGYEQGWAVRTATTTSLASEGHRVYLVTLYQGNEYKFQAVGDKNAVNIDVILYDSEGKLQTQDLKEDISREAMITFKPTKTSTYYVTVYADKIVEGIESAGVALAVTYK